MSKRGRHRRSSSHLALWCTALTLCLVAAGACLRLIADGTGQFSAGNTGALSPTSHSVSTTPVTTSTIVGVPPKPAPSTPEDVRPPVHLTIASIGVSTDLQRLTLAADGSLQAPTKWDVAGWYADGVVPGAVGPAVIAGHIDSTSGPAVFYRLRELVAGATVTVTEQGGAVLSFVVDDVRDYPKDQFPTNTVYGPTPTPELRLISCTGEFDTSSHRYLNNLVVSAHLG